ncbi:hypothetical protein B0H10DRAFT_2227261 [Mycena sp. CBHHK59/15]|nr:hypothetical protein B0H10DRAFT_2227261 [Mycena sp. CBHHK59/15]
MTDMFADDPWNVGMPKVTPEVGLPNEIAMLNNSGLLNDIIMHEGGTNNVIEPQLNVWASHREGQSDRSYPAKRMAITNPGRAEIDDAREVADIAKERAKAAIREKRELEAMLAKARQEMQGLRDEQQRQHAEMLERDTQWRTHLENFKGQVHHDFEQQRVRNYEYVKGQMQADLNAREAEYQKNLAEIEENNRRQEDIRRREQEREKADYETKLAAYHARFSSQRVGTRLAQDSGIDVPHFPDAPPGAGSNDPRVVQRLKGMVDELMTGKGGGVKKSSPRKKKIGTASALVKARKEEQEKLKPEDDRRWKKITIEHWRLKTGLNRAKDFYDYQGVTNETHERCEDGETAPDANSNRCTLYFGFGWANALWNQHIVDNLVKLVLRKRAEDPGRYDVPDVSDEYLKALFNNYLKEARAEWSRHQPRAGESLEDARERAEAYDAERRDKNNGTSRKKAKHTLRRKTTEKMLHVSVAKDDQAGAKVWRWLRDELIDELGIAGMSSEEDEPAEVTCGNTRKVTTVHNIKIHPWRAQKVNDYVEMIDDTTEKCMMKLVNKRMRMRTGDKSRSGPPLQLPRALFDPAWLSKQKEFIPDIEEHLQISEKKFEMMEIEVANLN